MKLTHVKSISCPGCGYETICVCPLWMRKEGE